MPRRSLVDISKVFDVLLSAKDDIILEGGVIAGPTNKVWNVCSEKLSYLVTAKSLYTIVKCNRHNCLEKLGGVSQETCVTAITASSLSASSLSGESEGEQLSPVNVEPENDTIRFTITLSPEEWLAIKPSKKIYKRTEVDRTQSHRHYDVLNPGVWTTTVNSHFWDHTSLPCCLSFKRAKVHPYVVSFYVNMEGFCSECGSMFSGTIQDEPNEGSRVLISCLYVGLFRKKHVLKRKRRLAGQARKDAVDVLCKQNMSAAMFVRLKADETMKYGGDEPSHVPSNAVTRKAKSEGFQASRHHHDPLKAIEIFKHKSSMKQETIRDIGLDRFFVHYWSNFQIHLYRAYCRSSRYPKISIDATGGVVWRLNNKVTGKTSGNIFLYEITVHDKTSRQQYSAGNMLSERHDANSIHHWLGEWLRSGAIPPNEVVTDMSLALMYAVIKAFTQFNSLTAYATECSKILSSFPPFDIVVPSCFVRNDIAHLVKMFMDWPCFRGKNFRIRDFYTRAMCQVAQSTDKDDIKQLLNAIFTIAMSQTEGVDIETGAPTRCELSKVWLRDRISTGERTHIDEVIQQATSSENSTSLFTLMDESLLESSSFEGWCSSIAAESTRLLGDYEGDHDNCQYLPDIIPLIIKLCKLLPFWSAVMVPYFGRSGITASSASSESSFNDTKNRVFKHKKLPIRVDDFLEVHINSLAGQMKLVAADSIDMITSVPSPNSSDVSKTSSNHPRSDDIEECIPTNTISKEQNNLEEDLLPPSPFLADPEMLDSASQCGASSVPTPTHVELPTPLSCKACSSGDLPTGAHCCVYCNVAVHVFPECSLAVSGSEEGYGQPRICWNCSKGNVNELREDQTVENWRAMALPLKKRSMRSKLDPAPDYSTINLSLPDRFKVIGLLKNGHRQQLKPVKLNNEHFMLSNTCSLDAILQLLCIAYCDSEKYKEFSELQAHKPEGKLYDLVQDILTKGVGSHSYRKRVELVIGLECFKVSQLLHHIKEISIECTAKTMAQHVMKMYPSVVETSKCSEGCDLQDICFPVVCVDCALSDIELLPIILERKFESDSIPCDMELKRCCGLKSRLYTVSPVHLLIELVDINKREEEININVNAIPKKITILAKEYLLRGVVEFIGNNSSSSKSIGHYVGLARRPNEKWEIYNDLLDKKIDFNMKSKTKCHLILFTV